MNYLAGLMICEMESEQKARTNAEKMKNCPKLLSCGVTETSYYGFYISQVGTEWWFEVPAKNPGLLGAKKIRIEMIKKLIKPDNFSFKKNTNLKDNEPTPCGSNCSICQAKDQYHCSGCPALS
ncbi:MAG: hypothetical protein ACFFB2_01620 [Promethearchaeota archaeon]